MTDIEDPNPTKKSSSDLKAIPGGAPAQVKPDRKYKPKNKDIHHQIVQAMLGKFTRWPAFPAKFHRLVDPEGHSLIYEEANNGIVHLVSHERVEHVVALYWEILNKANLSNTFLGFLAADDATKTRRLWLITAPARKDPFPLVTWASDSRPSLHKIPFDPMSPEDIYCQTPLFDEMMARTTNAETLKAFIGSIFDEQSFRQQYLWIYGGGRNGKGALIRCLGDLLAHVYTSEEAPSKESKHWTSGLLNKRLVVFADCNDTRFIIGGRFKSLTGGDKIRVEIKQKSIFSADIPAKYIFTSNDRPSISSSAADLRRIIYCYIAAVKDGVEIPDYEEQLKLEVPAFISACWHQYQTATEGNPRRKLEVSNQAEVQDLARSSEHEYEAFVDGRINVVSYPDTVCFNTRAYIRPERMKELMILSGFKTNIERDGLRKYLERVHGIVCKRINVCDKVFPAMLNCSEFPAKDTSGD